MDLHRNSPTLGRTFNFTMHNINTPGGRGRSGNPIMLISKATNYHDVHTVWYKMFLSIQTLKTLSLAIPPNDIIIDRNSSARTEKRSIFIDWWRGKNCSSQLWKANYSLGFYEINRVGLLQDISVSFLWIYYGYDHCIQQTSFWKILDCFRFFPHEVRHVVSVSPSMRTIVSAVKVKSKMAEKTDKGSEKSFLARTASIASKRTKRAQEKVR